MLTIFASANLWQVTATYHRSVYNTANTTKIPVEFVLLIKS